jgi:hypothetical protein
MRRIKTKLFLTLLFALNFVVNTKSSAQKNSPEEIVDKLYELVTFEKGTEPDWGKVKELFIDEAIIVLRTSRTDNTIFDPDGFVSDFKRFIDDFNVKETGFSENILKKHGRVFGDIAWYMVLYEAKIPETEKQNKGIDHFSLVKKNGEWKIVSITNEIPTKERVIPEELAD